MPGGRQLRRLRHRRRLVPGGPHPRRHQGLRQRLPAPWPRAEGLRRPLQRVPVQLPRLHLAPRRHAAAHARRRRSSRTSRPTATPGGCPRRKVGTWGGFVFINPDPDGEPLEEFLGTLPEHFARWDFEHRYLQAHVAKKIRCNWKVAQEAFDEGLHLGATHPQSAPYVGDANAAVDVYGWYARQISPSGTPIEDLPLDADRGRHPQAHARRPRGRGRCRSRSSSAPPRATRWPTPAASAGARCSATRPTTISDAELVDHWNYAVFPNFHPWGGYNRIVYRFRPNGDRHDECIFEVMFLTPFRGRAAADRADAPSSTSTTRGPMAPELQTLALVMEQDTFNMESVQRGLETTRHAARRWSRHSRRASSRGGTTCSPTWSPRSGRDAVVTDRPRARLERRRSAPSGTR